MSVCKMCFPLLSLTLREPLLPVSWQSEVTRSHTVALLAWLCHRVPSACPGKGLQWSCWAGLRTAQCTLASHTITHSITQSQNRGPLQLAGESPTDLGHLLLLLAGFWGRGKALGYTSIENVVRTVLLIPCWLGAVMGPNTSCCSSFPCLSPSPDPFCFFSLLPC